MTYGMANRTSAHLAVDRVPRIQLYTSRTTSECRCKMNVCTAVTNDTTATPASTRVTPVRVPPNAAPIVYVNRTVTIAVRNAMTGAGSTAQSGRGVAAHGEHDRRAEARSGRCTEEVGIDERVAEHALVAGPGERQHPADDTRQHDPRHAHLPDHVPLGVRHAAVDGDQWQVVEQRQRHAPPDRPGGTDHRPEQQRCEQDEHRPDDPARCRHPGVDATWWTASDTVRTRSTTRGPHREAMSSSSSTMSPLATAVMASQPGRADTTSAV